MCLGHIVGLKTQRSASGRPGAASRGCRTTITLAIFICRRRWEPFENRLHGMYLTVQLPGGNCRALHRRHYFAHRCRPQSIPAFSCLKIRSSHQSDFRAIHYYLDIARRHPESCTSFGCLRTGFVMPTMHVGTLCIAAGTLYMPVRTNHEVRNAQSCRIGLPESPGCAWRDVCCCQDIPIPEQSNWFVMGASKRCAHPFRSQEFGAGGLTGNQSKTVVLLRFWAVWCASCVPHFRFVLGLQDQPVPADSPLTNILNCHRVDNC